MCPVETLGGALQLGARCASPLWEVVAWVAAGLMVVALMTAAERR